jgi:dicarboxylate/amino acid:cation (Na+ or H+) symporter, DAACS family
LGQYDDDRNAGVDAYDDARVSGLGPQSRRRKLALHWRIVIGLVVGAAGGILARILFPPAADGVADPRVAWVVYYLAEPAGQIFLRLIFMIVLPLLFCALVLGVANTGDIRRLGRMGLSMLVFTILFSTVSVLLGMFLANTVQPGARLPREQRDLLRERFAVESMQVTDQAAQSRPVRDALLDIIPRNPFQEMVGAIDGTASGGILAVMFFALAFGIALLFAKQRAGPLLAVLEGVYDVTMVIVSFAMWLAPVGVAGLMFALTAMLGFYIFQILAWYVATVLAGLSLHTIGFYSLFVVVAARMRPWRFFSAISDAVVTSFATASSNATLPTALRVAREKLHLKPEVGNFILTIGATTNQNGTALYQAVTVVFLAQVFGMDLTIAQQFTVALMCILAGIGTVGVPGGSIPFLAVILGSVGVPTEGIAIILGTDRLLDMCRTTLNVIGDMAIAACVDRWEGGSGLRV